MPRFSQTITELLGDIMKPFLAAVLLTLVAATPARAEEADGPSFDCARASTAAEHAICDTPGLGWYDRQLAKGWKIVLKATGKPGEADLRASQAKFLKTRDACVKSDDSYNCFVDAYLNRLKDLARSIDDLEFDVASYAADNGGVDLVRYPDRSVSLNISTVGGNDHTCTFDTDTARMDAKGVIRWSYKPDANYQEACTIKGTLRAGAIEIDASGEGCTYYCGARAELSGTFTLKD
jgi:uncharacterized protein